MRRAIRRYRNLCSSCHASWCAMLDRSEGASNFSYFDSVSTIGSRVGDDSCKNRNCSGIGLERFFGFCERCFHSSCVEWWTVFDSSSTLVIFMNGVHCVAEFSWITLKIQIQPGLKEDCLFASQMMDMLKASWKVKSEYVLACCCSLKDGRICILRKARMDAVFLFPMFGKVCMKMLWKFLFQLLILNKTSLFYISSKGKHEILSFSTCVEQF